MENKSFGLIAKAESKLDGTGNWASAKVWNCRWCKASDCVVGSGHARETSSPNCRLRELDIPIYIPCMALIRVPMLGQKPTKLGMPGFKIPFFPLVHIISGFLNMNAPSSNLGEFNFLGNKLLIAR